MKINLWKIGMKKKSHELLLIARKAKVFNHLSEIYNTFAVSTQLIWCRADFSKASRRFLYVNSMLKIHAHCFFHSLNRPKSFCFCFCLCFLQFKNYLNAFSSIKFLYTKQHDAISTKGNPFGNKKRCTYYNKKT